MHNTLLEDVIQGDETLFMLIFIAVAQLFSLLRRHGNYNYKILFNL